MGGPGSGKLLTAFQKSSRGRVRKSKSRREKSPIRPIFHEDFPCENLAKDWQKKIDNLIAEMIVLDNLPYNFGKLTILQTEGFRKLISFIAPTYKISSYEKMRDTIIPSISSRIVEVVLEVLNYCDVVTIMLDLWSYDSMLGFMEVSCSSVTADYIPFTCFLNMKEMPIKFIQQQQFFQSPNASFLTGDLMERFVV